MESLKEEKIRLTQYSHGAGCGCKISPKVLGSILQTGFEGIQDPNLLVGNESRDDAAVYDMGNGKSIISTTDFFMPIVDDPFTFGRIAATNALSDIYAMGGKPLMAIAILGWPINQLPPEIAGQVVDGGRQACKDAGIALAGGHSIDSPEPIFGLAATGEVAKKHIKQNNTAKAGDVLFLTKPLGIGALSTARKKQLLEEKHEQVLVEVMCQLNVVGQELATLDGLSAMTDVTGFGLAGHLVEMCEGSGLSAMLHFNEIPLIDELDHYLDAGAIPGGTNRNWDSYGHHLGEITERQRNILCDPQTSGGLLIAVSKEKADAVQSILRDSNLYAMPIGEMTAKSDCLITVH